MTNITNKALGELERKKISYDILMRDLEMIDELAKITSCTRTQILDAIIFPGTISQTNFMIETWKEWSKTKGIDKKKQEKLKILLKKVEEFMKKWEFDKFDRSLKQSVKKS